MDVLIITNFRSSFSLSDNSRFVYIAKQLAKAHDVEILTNDFHHEKKEHSRVSPVEWPFKITCLHEPGYRKNVCLKRFVSHYIWGRNVDNYLKKRKRPDVIYCAVPSLTGPLCAAKYCEKNDVRFIVDIQDLWPEAFRMIFNIPVISDMIFAPFTAAANGIYSRADCICAVSNTYSDRALSVNHKKADKHTVFLGTRLKDFDENAEKNAVPNKPKGELRLGYCGTLGSSYDLTCVFDAIELVAKKRFNPPKFIIMGDGPRRAEFEKYAAERGVDVDFTGLLPYDKMCGMLKTCDIVVNPITKGAAQSIINKHADYAASGLPVLNTQEYQEYRQLVEKYHMGFNCENNNAEELANSLILLIQNEALRKEMGINARRCAEECFDRENSYGELISAITVK